MSAPTDAEPNPYGVKPGQIWVDCDLRYHGKRRLRIHFVFPTGDVDLHHPHARCEVLTPCKGVEFVRIRLDRFRARSNGYRLVKESK